MNLKYYYQIDYIDNEGLAHYVESSIILNKH